MKKNKILSITQINIKLSDKKEIQLTADEARKVLLELKNLFNHELGVSVDEILEKLKDSEKEKVYVPQPYPIYIEKSPSPWQPPYWKWDKVWCSNETTNFPENEDITTNKDFLCQNNCLSINLTKNTQYSTKLDCVATDGCKSSKETLHKI